MKYNTFNIKNINIEYIMFLKFKDILINLDILQHVEINDWEEYSINFYTVHDKKISVYFNSVSELKNEFEKLHEILNSIKKSE